MERADRVFSSDALFERRRVCRVKVPLPAVPALVTAAPGGRLYG
jgi:hypothetical protein